MAYVTIAFSKGFDLDENEFVRDIPGPVSLACLLGDRAAARAQGMPDWLLDGDTGRVADAALVTLNGCLLGARDTDAVMVSPGDRLYIMPALTGG
ncbi:MAG: hypothetical protein FWG28_00415 [Clostridiales bacterium]|nr:hypothetical protein [Clostridiales bacterium]